MVPGSKRVSITIPLSLAKELRHLAKIERRSLAGILQEAARYYLYMRQWRSLQEQFSTAVARGGIHSEDDVQKLIEDYRLDQ